MLFSGQSTSFHFLHTLLHHHQYENLSYIKVLNINTYRLVVVFLANHHTLDPYYHLHLLHDGRAYQHIVYLSPPSMVLSKGGFQFGNFSSQSGRSLLILSSVHLVVLAVRIVDCVKDVKKNGVRYGECDVDLFGNMDNFW